MTDSPTDPTVEQQIDALDLPHLIGFARTKAADARRGETWAGTSTAHLLDRLANELYQSRHRELRARDAARQAELERDRERERRAQQRRARATRRSTS